MRRRTIIQAADLADPADEVCRLFGVAQRDITALLAAIAERDDDDRYLWMINLLGEWADLVRDAEVGYRAVRTLDEVLSGNVPRIETVEAREHVVAVVFDEGDERTSEARVLLRLRGRTPAPG